MADSTDALLVEREGSILKLTLNRPDRLNALNRDMQHALEAELHAAGEAPDVRVIIITGAGRGFCSGADMGGLRDSAEAPPDPSTFVVPKFTNRQAGIFKPTICAVNGVCAGAGLHFIADSDIVIASEAASFVDTHVDVGQVTALEPIGLMRRMPLSAVLRLAILGKAERLNAQQALATSMVSEVVPADQLMPRAMELARIVAAVSPAAVQKSLKAIWDSLEMPLAQAYENGFDILIRHRAHPDALEGPKAFAEKRSPVWTV
ncbi:enoyl-CoA hydratase/isomerase family protein [Sphingobium sp. TKS]|uniref:enoyl-CoA hydratase/isomerase family protein n=1 Tax=Sphingobium sp. TKS TaxID=1315974 RepID=UPI000770284C|nr:enoyl-CoA hydratase/isomerase family protein [Sphingobium sp. TKS]AMK25608.1 enoyl-CoA hydratase/isomerase [Sphingobium sp. TKS]